MVASEPIRGPTSLSFIIGHGSQLTRIGSFQLSPARSVLTCEDIPYQTTYQYYLKLNLEMVNASSINTCT